MNRMKTEYVKGHARAICSGRNDLNLDEMSDEEFDALTTDYYSFTSIVHHSRLNKLYCGTTNRTNDVLQEFDLNTDSFESMNYREFGERYEIKIHRSLAVGEDNCVYGATSALHNTNRRPVAPGGKLFKFDPETAQYTLLSIPCEFEYVQTISLNWERQIICGMTYPVFKLFVYDMARKEIIYEQYMASISHIGDFDDDGGYWGTWKSGREHNLFRYDPEKNEVKYFKHGFSVPCYNLMYGGAGPIDCMINGRDGYLYIGHESGELYQLDPRSGELTYLVKPLPGNRLPAIDIGPDGRIYGYGGNDWEIYGFAYDRATGLCERSEILENSETGEKMFRAHDLAIVGNRQFVCETDVKERGAYLWEIGVP